MSRTEWEKTPTLFLCALVSGAMARNRVEQEALPELRTKQGEKNYRSQAVPRKHPIGVEVERNVPTAGADKTNQLPIENLSKASTS